MKFNTILSVIFKVLSIVYTVLFILLFLFAVIGAGLLPFFTIDWKSMSFGERIIHIFPIQITMEFLAIVSAIICICIAMFMLKLSRKFKRTKNIDDRI